MFYRILWTAIIGMLMIVPLHAERKKANLQEDFARKKVTDSQAELYAEARIDVDHDKWSELQSRGTEFKAYGEIKGIAPDDDYEGYYGFWLTAREDYKYFPDGTGDNPRGEWTGEWDDDLEAKWKWTGDPKHLSPPAKFLSHCSATAQIVGGANMHDYDGHEYHYEHVTHAYAYDFSHADADEWDCFLSGANVCDACE